MWQEIEVVKADCVFIIYILCMRGCFSQDFEIFIACEYLNIMKVEIMKVENYAMTFEAPDTGEIQSQSSRKAFWD